MLMHRPAGEEVISWEEVVVSGLESSVNTRMYDMNVGSCGHGGILAAFSPAS